MKYETPAALIRAYFELHSQLSGSASLTPTGMPFTGGNSTREHVQTRFGDHVLCLRGLDEDEFRVLVLRYAYKAGIRTYTRYVRGQEQLQPHEEVTGRTHPDDEELLEVTGPLVRGMNRQEMAKHLRVGLHRIDQWLARAHRKVQDEMEKRESKDE